MEPEVDVATTHNDLKDPTAPATYQVSDNHSHNQICKDKGANCNEDDQIHRSNFKVPTLLCEREREREREKQSPTILISPYNHRGSLQLPILE